MTDRLSIAFQEHHVEPGGISWHLTVYRHPGATDNKPSYLTAHLSFTLDDGEGHTWWYAITADGCYEYPETYTGLIGRARLTAETIVRLAQSAIAIGERREQLRQREAVPT